MKYIKKDFNSLDFSKVDFSDPNWSWGYASNKGQITFCSFEQNVVIEFEIPKCICDIIEHIKDYEIDCLQSNIKLLLNIQEN